MFKIKGNYRGKTEILDSCDCKHEAIRLAGEYRMAYGKDWTVWVTDGRGNDV